DAEARLDHALARLDRLFLERPLAALAVEHAFRRPHHDLRPPLGGGPRLLVRIAPAAHLISAGGRPHPADADPLDRLFDRVLGAAAAVAGTRREDVLAAGRRGIVVVDDNDHAVLLVEDGVADAAGEAVVPEAAVAHHRDRAPPRLLQSL